MFDIYDLHGVSSGPSHNSRSEQSRQDASNYIPAHYHDC